MFFIFISVKSTAKSSTIALVLVSAIILARFNTGGAQVCDITQGSCTGLDVPWANVLCNILCQACGLRSGSCEGTSRQTCQCAR